MRSAQKWRRLPEILDTVKTAFITPGREVTLKIVCHSVNSEHSVQIDLTPFDHALPNILRKLSIRLQNQTANIFKPLKEKSSPFSLPARF